MRLLVYGNSHVGAWQAAWPGIAAEWPDVTVTFFSLPEKIFARYRLQGDGRFRPRRAVSAEDLARVQAINGRVECDLSGHDRVVRLGVAWQPERAVEMAALADPPGMEGAAMRGAYGPGLVTAAFDELAAAVMADWPGGEGATTRPILFGRPVYAETCRESLHRLYAPWRAAAPFAAASQGFLAAWRAHLARAAAARGITFLTPPPGLHGPSGGTLAAYLAAGGGVVDPAQPAARGDHSHMNAAYGAVCFRHLMAVLAQG